MKRSSYFVAICFFFSLFSSRAVAQQRVSPQTPRQESPAISVQNVKGNIFQIKGGAGANTGFFVAEKEVFVIDAKMTAESAQQMIAEIRKVTANPITKVALTHSDGDHVNGLVGFPQGIDVICQDNTRADMEKAFQADQERTHLPNVTFSDRLSLFLGSGRNVARVDLLYFGPAHTSGDAVIFFPEEKVAFIGDLLFLGRDPLIHRAKNGTSFGLVKVLKAILNLDADTFVSGHNELSTKKEIQDLAQSIEEKQEKIRSMVKEGKTLEQVKKAFNVETPPGGSRWPGLVEVIYLDLTEKK